MFPDNTVLINLGYLGRISLIGQLFPRRHWCATVSAECRQSARAEGLARLHVEAAAVFGEPLRPEGPEHVDIRQMLDELRGPGDLLTAHLGEVETIAIIDRRGIPAVFVTDDHAAGRMAIARDIQVASTWRLLKLAHLSPDPPSGGGVRARLDKGSAP